MLVSVRGVVNARAMQTEDNSAELPQAFLCLVLRASLQHLESIQGNYVFLLDFFSQCF